MTIDLKSMAQHWKDASLMELDGHLVIPSDFTFCQWLMLIRRTMVEVARTSDDLFRKPDRVRKGRRGVVATRTGRDVEKCLSFDVRMICKAFPHHRFDPYFSLFAETYCASPLWRSEYLRRNVDQLNQFVSNLRAGAKRAGFKENVANHERGTIKNAKTVEKYLNALYGDYPKILHVRIDLHYASLRPLPDAYPVSLEHQLPDPFQISAEQMKSDRAKLMRYVRKKFRAVAIGHMWTVEFGEMKGPHFHVLLHFNGHKVRQGITIAQELGEYWQNVITNGRGRYWNVNKFEDAFEAEGRRGIGLISHADMKRRENLLRAALYLVKTDLFVRVVMPGFGKTFGHGVFRPRKKSKAGRKRKGHRLHAWIDAISARRGLKRSG